MTPCSEFTALVDPFLTGETAPTDAVRLRRHLEACPSCRGHYDRRAEVIATFEGHPGLPTDAAIAWIGSAWIGDDVLDAVAPTAARPHRWTARARFGWPVGVAVAAAAVFALLWTPTPTPIERDDVLTARGVSSAPRTATRAIRVFCIDVTGATPALIDAAGSGGPAARCPHTGRLQLAYSLGGEAPAWLSIFARTDHGEPIWYWPPSGNAAGARVEPGHDIVLPGSFDLAAGHTPGAYRVYGVFSHGPLSHEALVARAARPSSDEAGSGSLRTVELIVGAQ